MKLYDRLYKEMKFDPIIESLLTCPGLLRLRDVRMANNQLFSFPSFSTTTRYEHSLGVCYLAGICADSLGLNEKDKMELMLACLYHDVGTPPFAHAMEEILQAKFGFDHEINLRNLIVGTTSDIGGEFTQIYQGEGLKIRSVCQSKRAVALGLDVHRIANLAAGDKNDHLSPLINSNGMDLDNIDNIFRASSAMGIIPADGGEIAITLAKSFIIDDNQVKYNNFYLSEIQEWQRIRNLQYSAIFDSIDDFSYQTMIKKAVNILIEDDDVVEKIDISSWKLTDSEITHKLLMKHPRSKKIMERVLLCKPFTCLGIVYVEGNETSKYANLHLSDIEERVSKFLRSKFDINHGKNEDEILVNFFPDKRKRKVQNIISPWDRKNECTKEDGELDGVLLGFFTPYTNSYYKEFEVEGEKFRKTVSFTKKDLYDLMVVLSKEIFMEYNIREYGGKENREVIEQINSSQLGFF